MLFIAKQAAKHERRRQFQAAERERKSKNKTAAELAQEQRELQVRQQQEVRLVATGILHTTHKSAVVHSNTHSVRVHKHRICLLTQAANPAAIMCQSYLCQSLSPPLQNDISWHSS